MWWEEAPPRPHGQDGGDYFPPRVVPAGWTGRRFHPGDNEEDFDVEIYTIYQALRVLEASCTVYSDSAAAIGRDQTDRERPGQAFARAIIEIAERLGARGGTSALRWTPAHKGVEGSEVADDFAKGSGAKHMGRRGPTVPAGVPAWRAWQERRPR